MTKAAMAEATRAFACPFIFKDQKNQLGCRKYELKRIKDVKQHLLRVHKRPPYCPRCYDTFDNDEERDSHVRACQVENHPQVNINGISDDQQKILQKRSNPKHTVEKQWYFLWETIFPDTNCPTSVYLDEVYSSEMFRLREFMTTEGVAIVRNCLNAHGAIRWNQPTNEPDVISFEESVVRGVLERLFEEWSGYCVKGVVNLRPPPTPALPAVAPATMPPQNNSLGLMKLQRPAETSSSMSLCEVNSVAGRPETTIQPESDIDFYINMLGQQCDGDGQLGSWAMDDPFGPETT
ncbi:hypothetical protein F5Y08DRAFT_355406 [Xylaria arbuscula]|nr:hypothetical protein F5Y08DRAFT_355406 [Xylaria arbuscula]